MATSNPVERGPTPPFPDQPQPKPGLESEMSPTPDYGEDSYRGSVNFTVRRRSSPEATQASGAPSR